MPPRDRPPGGQVLSVRRRPATARVLLAGLLLLPGCTPDFYKRSADKQVYQILRDRKYDTVGYNPQALVGDAAVRDDAPGAASAAEAKEAAAAEAGKKIVPGPGTSAVPAKAYDVIPATVLPPVQPPPLDLAADREPYGPPGPWAGGADAGVPAAYEPNEARSAIGTARDRLSYGPPAPGSPPVSLDLFRAVAYGVQHSRTYRDQMDALYLSALDVTLQRHLFEPRPFSQLGLAYTGGQGDVAYKSAYTATANVGVRQKLPYGGEVVAEALVSFVNAISDNAENGESAQLALSGSLPLLRGAGLVNLEPLIASERAVVYQIRTFEDFRRQYAVDVTTQYYRVLTTLQSVNNRRQNVSNLRDLMERARILFGAPKDLRARQSFLEVQRAEQSLLQGQDDLLQAELQYLNTLDDFKLLLGMDIRQELTIVPVSLEATVPNVEALDVITLAERFRLDLQTARDRVDDARRLVAVTENGLLPDLNLVAQGQGGNPTDTAARQFGSRSLTYSAGVTLDLPLDRVAERNAYRQAQIAYYAARRRYEDLHDSVVADVRTAVRAIRQAQNSVSLQRRSIELAQRRLENASLLLRIGASSSTRDYVEAQSSLLTAQDRYDQAVASLQVQILQFLRQTGTLRVDPTAGTLGKATDRAAPPPVDPLGEPTPLDGALRDLPGLRAGAVVPARPANNPPVGANANAFLK